MKKLSFIIFLFLANAAMGQKGKWVDLFNGKDLNDWKISENPQTFKVEDGRLIVDGPRAHLYYNGPFQNHVFKDFELELQIKTNPGANSGVYVHTDFQENTWPSKGYEIQVNNSHTDWRRSASLYNIVDCAEVFMKDNEWYTMTIKVQGKHIITKLNGTTVVDYTEPEKPLRGKGQENRLFSQGTIAIQGHDPKSHIEYKSIRIKVL